MELNHYQHSANRTDQYPLTGPAKDSLNSIAVPMLGLAVEASKIMEEHKKWLRDGDSYKIFPEQVSEELGDLLWYLANLATKHGLTLEHIASQNLAKIARRWPNPTATPSHRKLFDHHFPPEERLPKHIDAYIEDNSGVAITTINGVKFGDPLTDNSYHDDGYRFHDLAHISHAALLGWSPVLRSLLKRKRKSNPDIDMVEDGGRAIAIEEGISAMVFNYAEQRNFLEGAQAVDYTLLQTIKTMTSHLEVSARTEAEWEHTIMTWLRIWRQVRTAGRGRIHAHLEKATLTLVE